MDTLRSTVTRAKFSCHAAPTILRTICTELYDTLKLVKGEFVTETIFAALA